MSLMDRRIKRCPNMSCQANKKKTTYSADKSYCSSCGTELVFVCKKCGSKIEDRGPKHIICERCTAAKQDRVDRLVDTAKTAGTAIATAGAAIAAVAAKSPEVLSVAKDVVDTIKPFKH